MSATPNIRGEKIFGSITGITLFSATTISGGTFFGDGSNLSGIIGGSGSSITGGTYLNNTLTFTNNTGGTFNVLFDTFTGATINGNLLVTGTTSSETISATTYQNLPSSTNILYKQITANTTTTNLTYTDVPGLAVSADTAGVYEFSAVLLTGSDTSAGMRIGMTVPASSTDFYYNIIGTNSAAANQTQVEGAASGSLVTTFASNAVNNQTGITKIDGIVTTTQSGEIKIGFAKITSGTATIRAGSYLRITKIA